MSSVSISSTYILFFAMQSVLLKIVPNQNFVTPLFTPLTRCYCKALANRLWAGPTLNRLV